MPTPPVPSKRRRQHRHRHQQWPRGWAEGCDFIGKGIIKWWTALILLMDKIRLTSWYGTHPILYRFFPKVLYMFSVVVGKFWTINSISNPFWKFRLKLHFAASFFIEADFTPPKKNVGWVRASNNVKVRIPTCGSISGDWSNRSRCNFTFRVSCLQEVGVRRWLLWTAWGDDKHGFQWMARLDWSWTAPEKNGAWKSTSTYLWVFCFFPRKFQGRSFFLKLGCWGMLKDHFGLTKTPPKLLADELRSKICFYKQIFEVPFLGDDIFLGSILDILWYFLLFKLYHYIISELISQKWTDFDRIKWCGCWSVVKYGPYEKTWKWFVGRWTKPSE